MDDLEALLLEVLDIVEVHVLGADTRPARFAIGMRPRPDGQGSPRGPGTGTSAAAVAAVRLTFYDQRMTMLSFRVDDGEAAAAQTWADRLGIDKSELIREALHQHLVRLRAEHELRAWNDEPLSEAELSLGEIAHWGPAEDWSDWTDAAR